MINKVLFLIFPAIIFAGSIDISFNNSNGKSTYTVLSNNNQNLESKLVFPFNFNFFDIQYKHNFKYLDASINSSILLNHKITQGEDFDWKNNNLTVYSKSNNIIDKYYDIGIKLDKNIYKNINIIAKFDYKILNLYWNNTYQKDYVQNKSTINKNKSLIFQQEFYLFNIGISNIYNISNSFELIINPKLVYAYINTKDTHILRNFYTLQNIKSLGYDINCILNYKITNKSNFKISFEYMLIKNNNVNMNYYFTNTNDKFASYPSSYKYINSTIGIHYNYKF